MLLWWLNKLLWWLSRLYGLNMLLVYALVSHSPKCLHPRQPTADDMRHFDDIEDVDELVKQLEIHQV